MLEWIENPGIACVLDPLTTNAGQRRVLCGAGNFCLGKMILLPVSLEFVYLSLADKSHTSSVVRGSHCCTYLADVFVPKYIPEARQTNPRDKLPIYTAYLRKDYARHGTEFGTSPPAVMASTDIYSLNRIQFVQTISHNQSPTYYNTGLCPLSISLLFPSEILPSAPVHFGQHSLVVSVQICLRH